MKNAEYLPVYGQQKTPNISPSRVSYGISLVSIFLETLTYFMEFQLYK